MSNNRVFISYSWGQKAHEAEVHSFTNFLRENGFEAEIDKLISQNETAINFTKMMHHAMDKAYDKVIVVLSEGYKKKAEEFSGGVGEEYTLLINDITGKPAKYILFTFDSISDNIIPFGLKGREIVSSRSDDWQNRLFSKLLDQPLYSFSPVTSTIPQIIPQTAAPFLTVPSRIPNEKPLLNPEDSEEMKRLGNYCHSRIVFRLDPGVPLHKALNKLERDPGKMAQLLPAMNPAFRKSATPSELRFHTGMQKLYANVSWESAISLAPQLFICEYANYQSTDFLHTLNYEALAIIIFYGLIGSLQKTGSPSQTSIQLKANKEVHFDFAHNLFRPKDYWTDYRIPPNDDFIINRTFNIVNVGDLVEAITEIFSSFTCENSILQAPTYLQIDPEVVKRKIEEIWDQLDFVS